MATKLKDVDALFDDGKIMEAYELARSLPDKEYAKAVEKYPAFNLDAVRTKS